MLKLVCLERLESLHLCDDDSFVLWSQDLWCSFCLWQCLPGLVDTRRGPTCALDIKWIRYALERFSRFAHSEISSRPWGVWTCFSPWKTGERMWMVRCTTAILRRLEPWDLRRKGFASISSQKSLPGSLFLTTVVAANKKRCDVQIVQRSCWYSDYRNGGVIVSSCWAPAVREWIGSRLWASEVRNGHFFLAPVVLIWGTAVLMQIS